MIIARHHTICPGCDAPIEPGDMIGPVGLSYQCAECVAEFKAEIAAAPVPTFPGTGGYEPGLPSSYSPEE